MGTQDIGWAVTRLRAGRFVRRTGWNGVNQYLYLEDPADYTPIAGAPSVPFVMIRATNGDRVPWLCSQADLLAEDWVEQAP